MPKRKAAVVEPAEPTSSTPRKRAKKVVDPPVDASGDITPKKLAVKVEVETSTPKSARKKKTEVKQVSVKTEETAEEVRTTIAKKRKVKQEPNETVGAEVTETKAKKNRKVKQEPNETVEAEVTETKVKKKRKTKEEKEAEAMPLAARTAGHKLFVGAHVSASGGVHKAIPNAVRIGGNAFALFLKSQRKWANPALTDDVANSYHSACSEHKYDSTKHVVPHGSYLVNLAHTDPERTKQAYDSFLDDVQRCERLGITLYNFHPGNTAGSDRATAIKHIASNLNRVHKATSRVVTLLENMAAAGGNVIGTTWEDLRDIIAHIDDKARIGVCLDTCHAFAAGYDLRSPEAYGSTMQSFDDIIGINYLRALHLNDSKAPLGARRDLHANIGTGFLGLRAFHNVANDPRLAGLPLVLETPIDVTDDDGEPLKDEKGNVKNDANIWAREIKLIEGLIDMDTTSADFLELEKSLARKGAKERKRIADQAERRKEKEAKQAAKGKKSKPASDSELSDLEDG